MNFIGLTRTEMRGGLFVDGLIEFVSYTFLTFINYQAIELRAFQILHGNVMPEGYFSLRMFMLVALFAHKSMISTLSF